MNKKIDLFLKIYLGYLILAYVYRFDKIRFNYDLNVLKWDLFVGVLIAFLILIKYRGKDK